VALKVFFLFSFSKFGKLGVERLRVGRVGICVGFGPKVGVSKTGGARVLFSIDSEFSFFESLPYMRAY
jgi:hypothetical protein